MTTQQSNLRAVRFILIGLLLVVLCGSTAIGGFYFGRRSLDNNNEPTAAAGVTTPDSAETVDPADTNTPPVVGEEATSMVGSDEGQEQPATSTSPGSVQVTTVGQI